MRISASVSSISYRDLTGVVSRMEAAGIDAFHLDSIESREVFQLARFLRPLSKLPMDLHLITSDPVKYWNDIRDADIEAITVQLEKLHSPLFIPPDLIGKVGIAVLANSPVESFAPYRDKAAWLLIMTTTPGYSGGTFQASHFEKIFRYRLAYPGIPIYVDGGVIPDIAAVLKMMGIEQIVSGSYLMNGSSIEFAVSSLRDAIPDEGTVKDIMIRRSHWPADFQFLNNNITLAEPEDESQWFINKRGELSKLSRRITGALPLMVHEDTLLLDLHSAIPRMSGNISRVAVVNDLFQLTGLLSLKNQDTQS